MLEGCKFLQEMKNEKGDEKWRMRRQWGELMKRDQRLVRTDGLDGKPVDKMKQDRHWFGEGFIPSKPRPFSGTKSINKTNASMVFLL